MARFVRVLVLGVTMAGGVAARDGVALAAEGNAIDLPTININDITPVPVILI